MTIGRRVLIIDSELAYSATKAGVLRDALTGLVIAVAITSLLADDPNVVHPFPSRLSLTCRRRASDSTPVNTGGAPVSVADLSSGRCCKVT